MKPKTTKNAIISAISGGLFVGIGTALSTGSILGGFFVCIGIVLAVCSINMESNGVGNEIESMLCNDDPEGP